MIIIIIIIIIIIERKDLGGVMSKDCKDTLQTLKTVTKRECDTKWEQSICQMRLLINKFNAQGSGYVLERRLTEFGEITQSQGHYAVSRSFKVIQGHRF